MLILVISTGSCAKEPGGAEGGYRALVESGERGAGKAFIDYAEPVTFASGRKLLVPNVEGMAAMLIPEDDLVELNHMPWGTWTEREVPSVSRLTKELYEYFEDDYDFIFLVTNRSGMKRLTFAEMVAEPDKSKWPRDVVSVGGFCVTVKNRVEGLDLSRDLTIEYGSKGNLNAVVLLYDRSYIKYGPMLHEIGHRWGMNFPMELSAGGGHLGVTNMAGQMSYYMPFAREGEHFIVEKKRADRHYKYPGLTFNSWELYLMGLESLENLEPIEVLENMHYIDSRQNIYGGEILEYSPEQLVEVMGQRKPGVEQSQKEFRGLFVLLSDREVKQAEWEEFQSQVDWFTANRIDSAPQLNFYEATLGRAKFYCGPR